MLNGGREDSTVNRQENRDRGRGWVPGGGGMQYRRGVYCLGVPTNAERQETLLLGGQVT